MTKKLYEETNISDIASAIREKNGSNNQYTVAQMAEAVRAIITPPSLEALNAVANGDYVPSSGKDGFSSVHVDVPTGGADPVLQEKTATQNGIILPDTGYDGLSKVTVNVSGGGATGIVSPSYQGLSYCYLQTNGTIFRNYTSRTNYLNIFEVQANHIYFLAVGAVVGTRRRASFFPGRTYSQFEPYLFEPGESEEIFSDGVWLAPNTQNTDDTGGALVGRIIYTPPTNGVIVYFTDTTGVNCPAYCIDVYAGGDGTKIHIVTHSVGSNDASIDIYVNNILIRNIHYTAVRNDLAHSFDDIYNIFIGYNADASVTPDHKTRDGWCIYSPSDSSVTYYGENVSPNSIIQNWPYSTPEDFIIEI